MSLKYMVTGASGQLGTKVIDSLLTKVPAADIGAIVRREEAAAPLRDKGITVRLASYEDSAALEAAFTGVERLLLISSSEIGQRTAQHISVINAAKAADVSFVAYTSLLAAPTTPLVALAGEHAETEKALAASGLSYALLRNGWYSENYAMGAATAVELGALYGAAGDGKIASASRQDYAEAAATVLTGDLPASGTVYELAGDSAYTLTDLAAQISEISGKTIPYTNLDEASYAGALLKAGLPEGFAGMLAQSDFGASQGGLFNDSKTLSSLIGRPTTPWQETLAEFLK